MKRRPQLALQVSSNHFRRVSSHLHSGLRNSGNPPAILCDRSEIATYNNVGFAVRSPLRWRHSLTEFFLSQLWSKTVLLRFYANCYRDLRGYSANVGQWRKQRRGRVFEGR
jgi:hypothetical protein